MQRTIYRSIFIAVCIAFLTSSCSENNNSSTVTIEASDSIDSLAYYNKIILKDLNNPENYIQKARYLLRHGTQEEVFAEIDRAIKIDSLNPSHFNLKSDILYKRKQIGTSRIWAEKAKSIDPENIDANMRMAWIYLIVENYDKAIEHANIALKKDLYFADAYFVKGMAYKYQGNFKNAVSNFRTASEQNPDHYDAWLQLGDLHALAKNELAVAYFNNAISVDSSRYEGHYNKGYFLQENGEYQEALQVYSDLIRHNNSFYNAYFNRGYIYFEYLNEPDSAIHEFSKTIGFNPLNYKAFYNRGLAYEQAGNSSEALINFSKALELKPDYDLAAQAKSRVLEK